MKKIIQINDLLPLFPKQDDENIQNDIFNQYEMQKNAYKPNEPPPKRRGEYYSYQEENADLMVMLDSIINISGYGIGKTCGYILGCEKHKELYNQGKTNIKGFIIIVKTDILEDELKKQIICKCTKEGVYDTYQVRTAKDTEIERRINSILTYYQITHYKKFANELKSITDDQIKSKYSDYGFILDEAQALNNPIEGKNNLNPQELPLEKTIYYQFTRLVDSAERIKLFQYTATIATNDFKNYIPSINLANKKEDRVPLNTNLNTLPADQFEKLTRGKIIYIKEKNAGVERVFKGNKIGNTTMNGVKITMSDYQSYIYDKTESGEWGRNKMQASALVYPNGKLGNDGFDDYFEPVNNSNRLNIKSGQEPVVIDMFTTNLETYSVKYKVSLDIIREVRDRREKVLIYDEIVRGNIRPMSKMLELNGIEIFDGDSIYNTEIISGGYCDDNDQTSSYEIKDKYKISRGRAAIITQLTGKKEVRNILKAWNDPRNDLGEIIFIIILSRKARDGVNLIETNNMIRFTGPRHMAGYMQGMYRIIRAGGFVRMKSRTNKPIEVNIYNLVAYSSLSGESKDENLYITAEEKEKPIRQIMRKMKIVAINCHSQIKRNTEGVDYSLECDYMPCEYRCGKYYDPTKEKIRYNEYNLLFSRNEINKCIKRIIKFFNYHFVYSLTNLLNNDYFSKFNNIIILLSIKEIIFNKIAIRDKFGYSNFLYEDTNVLHISRDTSLETNTLDSYYSQNIITNYNKTFKQFFEEYFNPKLDLFLRSNFSVEDVYSLSLFKRAYLTEKVISEEYPQDITEKILQTSKYFLFRIREPITDINILKIEKELKNDGNIKGIRGRKKNTRTVAINNMRQNYIEGDFKFVHCYYLVNLGSTSLDASFRETRTEKIRILGKNGWVDADPFEQKAYQMKINSIVKSMIAEYEKFYVYGIILPKTPFKIVDPSKISKQGDKRKNKWGRVCSTITEPITLFSNVIKMGLLLPSNINTDYGYKIRVINDFLNKNRDEEGMQFYNMINNNYDQRLIDLAYAFIVYYENNNLLNLCSIIRKYLIDNGMMIVV